MDVDPPENFDPSAPNPFDIPADVLAATFRTRMAIANICQNLRALLSTTAVKCLFVTHKNAGTVLRMLTASGMGTEVYHLFVSLKIAASTVQRKGCYTGEEENEPREIECLKEFTAIVDQLPHVRILTISINSPATRIYSWGLWEGLHNTFIKKLVPGLQRLSIVSLACDTIPVPPSLIQLIGSAPNLRSLTVSQNVPGSYYLMNIQDECQPSLTFASINCPILPHKVASFPSLRRAHYIINPRPIWIGNVERLRGPLVTELSLRLDDFSRQWWATLPPTDTVALVRTAVAEGFPSLRHLVLTCELRSAATMMHGRLPPLVRLSLHPLRSDSTDSNHSPTPDLETQAITLAKVLVLEWSLHPTLEVVEILDDLFFEMVRDAIASSIQLVEMLPECPVSIQDRQGRQVREALVG